VGEVGRVLILQFRIVVWSYSWGVRGSFHFSSIS